MKVLIIKTSSLGDIIQCFPVVQYLKSKDPFMEIDWVVEKPFAELLEAHPDVNRVLPVNTKAWRKSFWRGESRQEIKAFLKHLRAVQYDLVLDLQGNIKSGLITKFALAKNKYGFGYATVAEWPNILFTTQRVNPPPFRNIRQDYLFIAQSALGDFFVPVEGEIELRLSDKGKESFKLVMDLFPKDSTRRVMVCPGSMWANKKLSKETLVEFLQLLQKEQKSCFMLVWGNEQERVEADEIQKALPLSSFVSPKVALPVLQRVMASVDLVVSMDSLPLHLAGTTSTATFSVFGPSSAQKYAPMGPQHRFYQGSCPYSESFDKRCRKLRTCPTGRCMKDIRGKDM